MERGALFSIGTWAPRNHRVYDSLLHTGTYVVVQGRGRLQGGHLTWDDCMAAQILNWIVERLAEGTRHALHREHADQIVRGEEGHQE